MADETNQSGVPAAARSNPVVKTIGWITGGAVGLYFGLYLLIPVVAIGIIWWVGVKTIHDNVKQLFLPAFSVQTAQLLMHSFGLMYIGKLNEYFVVDVVVVIVSAIGLIWLILKPGLGPLILLGIIQMLRVINGVFATLALTITGASAMFPEFGEGVGTPKSLLLHAMLSALAIVLMILAYLKFRKSTNVA